MKFYYPPVVRTFEGLRGLGAGAGFGKMSSRATLGQYVVDKLQDPANLKDRKNYFTNALVQSWSARPFNLPSLASLSRGASYASKEAVLAAARNYLSQADIDKALAKAKENRQADATIILGFGSDVRDAISSATPTEAAAAIKALVFKTPWGGFDAGKIQDSAMIVLRSVSGRVGGDTMERFLSEAFGAAPAVSTTAVAYQRAAAAAAGKAPAAPAPAAEGSFSVMTGGEASASWSSGPAAPSAPPAGKQGQPSFPPAVDKELVASRTPLKAKFDDALLRYTQEGTAAAAAALDAAMNEYGEVLFRLRGLVQKRGEWFDKQGRARDAKADQTTVTMLDAEMDRIQKRPQVSKKPAGSAAPQTTDKERQEAAGGSSYTLPPPGSGMPSSPPPSSVVGPSYSAPAAAEPTSGGIEIPGLMTPQQQYAQQQAAKKGLSTGAWVGIGLGAAALLGVGIWAATRKRA